MRRGKEDGACFSTFSIKKWANIPFSLTLKHCLHFLKKIFDNFLSIYICIIKNFLILFKKFSPLNFPAKPLPVLLVMNKSATMTIFLAAAIFLLIIVDMAEAKGKGKKYGPKPKEEKAAECIEQEIGSDVWRFITCKKGKYCVRMTCKGKDVRACYDRADVCTNSMDFVQKYGGGSSKDECHSCNVCTPKDDGKYCNYGGAMDSEEEAPSIKGGAIGSEEAPSTENGAMGGEDVCTANGGDMDGTMAHCAIIWAGLAMALGLAAAAN